MIYCDYNSTAPLSSAVIDTLVALRSTSFYNSSSPHVFGKAALKSIHEVEFFLADHFQVDLKFFKLLFHSGATEGIYTFLLGRLNLLKWQNKKIIFLYSLLDHSSVLGVAEAWKSRHGELSFLPLDVSTGLICQKLLAQRLEDLEHNYDEILMNLTWGNGETGVVESLEVFAKLKKRFPKLKIHVDATQMPGKHPQAFNLPQDLDAYSFSGHKFGAFHGIGFSFYQTSYAILPIFQGGEQQRGLRSGTLPTELILSLQWALQGRATWEWSEKYSCLKTLEKSLTSLLVNKGKILLPQSERADFKLVNTIFMIIYALPSDQFLPLLEFSGVAASAGPACRSGSLGASQWPKQLGFEQWSKNTLRLSFAPEALSLNYINNFVATFGHFLEKIPNTQVGP